jgi:pantetheine-phosphate adenylyltransferase
MRAAIYPGSFDPMTNGHLSIIQRGLKMFDHLVVAIAVNPKKVPLFTMEERAQMIREALKGERRVEVDHFEGLLINYAKAKGVNVVLRGLRAMSDFEYEFQLANMNRKLSPELETVFMMTGEDYFYVSSNLVREVSSFGGDVEGMVPPNVLLRLRERHRSAARSPNPPVPVSPPRSSRPRARRARAVRKA